MGTSEQERLWEGEFGDAYTERNEVDPATRVPFLASVLRRARGVRTICELGANRGHNLVAFARIGADLALTGVEPNPAAFGHLSRCEGVTAVRGTIQSAAGLEPHDLVLCCGVLIHVAPDDLPDVFDRIFALSRRYVLLIEYFSPTPVEVEYRGQKNALFKRDFGADFLDRFPGQVRVVDYGFLWKRLEPAWDNANWWLFEKASGSPRTP